MKNWKTTLGGLLSGAGLVALDLFQHGTTDIKTIGTAVALFVLGALAKDFNVTGGTTAATPEAENRVTK